MKITEATTLAELAVTVSEALERAGVIATLSGGASASIYSDNRYQSEDLDFVTAEKIPKSLPESSITWTASAASKGLTNQVLRPPVCFPRT